MPLYSYKAVDSNGEVTRGIVMEKHIDDAYNIVLTSGLYILHINQASMFNNFLLEKFKGSGVEQKDIIEFALNLSVMLNAGMPLLTSLKDIVDATDNKRFKERIMKIKNSVEMGSSFSEAVSLHRDVFPDIFVKLIGAGEETGRFSKSLEDITVHLKRMEEMKRVIIRSLIYPIFALVTTTGAMLFWLIYVLPQLKDLFITMGTELPALTKGMIAASDFAALYWPIFIIIPAVLYITLKLLSRNTTVRYHIDTVKLKIPIIGQLIHTKILALFAEQLRILIAAGITIDRSFDIIVDVIDNNVFKKALRKIKEEIMLGSRISDALKKHGDLFPLLIARIVSVGETTGKLPEQLDYLAQTFINKLEDMSGRIGKLVEPIIILMVGMMFMLIIIGMLAPIFDSISNIE